VVLCPWVLAPTAGIDSAASHEIANASTSFSLELLKVLESVTVGEHAALVGNVLKRGSTCFSLLLLF
jgi:hypothetical protein